LLLADLFNDIFCTNTFHRAEREALKKKEEERVAREEQERLEDAARLGNPLLALSNANTEAAAGRIKRKWNDDVVFRNQAKGESMGKKKRFINDTVRNDFHRRFLDKFIL
jgi:protein CWC15